MVHQTPSATVTPAPPCPAAYSPRSPSPAHSRNYEVARQLTYSAPSASSSGTTEAGARTSQRARKKRRRRKRQRKSGVPLPESDSSDNSTVQQHRTPDLHSTPVRADATAYPVPMSTPQESYALHTPQGSNGQHTPQSSYGQRTPQSPFIQGTPQSPFIQGTPQSPYGYPTPLHYPVQRSFMWWHVPRPCCAC
jgi:hypothetical protein